MLTVDTDIVAGDWPGDADWPALAAAACAAALAQTSHAHFVHASYAVEIAVRLSDDGEVRQLNARYRAQDTPTNVLSFPMVQPDVLDALANSDDGEVLLGDIVLAAETCAAEAAAKGIALVDHARHLIVHGLFHLLGLDHGDEAAGNHMEALETAALAALRVADPYREPD